MHDSLPWRFHAAQHLARWLPPLLAPTVTSRLYDFERACTKPARPWITAITGSRARWPVDELHGWHHALKRYHDWRLLTVAQTVCGAGDTIVEVGANIGTETLCFADIVGAAGRVVALEPFRANVDTLTQVLADARADHVSVLPVAAGDKPGMLPFVAPDDVRFSGIGYLGTDGQVPTIDVEVTTLDRLADEGLQPALVAMDVEGGELAVIRGAQKMLAHTRPVIVLEACAGHAVRAGTSLEHVLAELEGLGYEVRAIRRYGLRPPLTAADAEPCNWIAVPTERHALLARVSMRIVAAGLLPPLRGLSPLTRRAESAAVRLLESSSSRGFS